MKRLPEQLLQKAPSGGFGKAVRLPIRQHDYASLEIWRQDDRGPETRIYTVMVNEVPAANVSGEPAKRIVQVLHSSGRRPVRPYDDLRTMQFSHHF